MKKLRKKKLSENTIKLMAEGYQESADEDLAIAKDFEKIENEINEKCPFDPNVKSCEYAELCSQHGREWNECPHAQN